VALSTWTEQDSADSEVRHILLFLDHNMTKATIKTGRTTIKRAAAHADGVSTGVMYQQRVDLDPEKMIKLTEDLEVILRYRIPKTT